MSTVMAQEESKGNRNFSDFGPSANLLAELEAVFRSFHESGIGKTRHYVHDDEEAAFYGCAPGTFTDWTRRPRRFRFSWRWASGKTARKFCWRSRTWAERARRPGGRSSIIWSIEV